MRARHSVMIIIYYALFAFCVARVRLPLTVSLTAAAAAPRTILYPVALFSFRETLCSADDSVFFFSFFFCSFVFCFLFFSKHDADRYSTPRKQRRRVKIQKRRRDVIRNPAESFVRIRDNKSEHAQMPVRFKDTFDLAIRANNSSNSDL